MGLLLRLSFFISPQTLPTMNESAPARRKIILEQDLTGFFEKLGQEHRPIFQLLRHVPPATFRILVDDDSDKRPEAITLDDFLRRAGRSFHPRTTLFTVKYRTYLFQSEWRSCAPYIESLDRPFNGEEQVACSSPEQLEGIVENFEGLLAYFMREALLEGYPFRLDRETCREFGFRTDDVQALRRTVARCHARIIREFAADYLRLGEILDAPEP